MTPTPAQIEAMLREALELFIVTVNPPYPQSMALWQEHLKAATVKAKAALTAAAEVDTMANPVARLDAGGANFAPQAALTAAAEAGEDAPCDDMEWEKAKRDFNNRTIERCAVVAEHAGCGKFVVAAIRALKDKP